MRFLRWAMSRHTLVRMLSQAVKGAVGTLDILVNNAETYPFASWWDSKPGDWLDTYNHDVLSGLRMIQRFVPGMVQRRWGRVISISSASGERVPSNQLPIYATSKSAQTHMTKLLAVELTNTGVTANVIAPAPVVTEGVVSAYTDMARREGRSTDWKDVEAHFVDTTLNDPPIRRMATAEEVAALAVYLASPLSDPVTRASYLIDVGFSLTGFRRVPTPLSVLQTQWERVQLAGVEQPSRKGVIRLTHITEISPPSRLRAHLR